MECRRGELNSPPQQSKDAYFAAICTFFRSRGLRDRLNVHQLLRSKSVLKIASVERSEEPLWLRHDCDRVINRNHGDSRSLRQPVTLLDAYPGYLIQHGVLAGQ